MVKAPLVTPDEAFGEKIISTLDAADFRLTVALWLKEEDQWTLVLGTPDYEKLGPQKAYVKLIEALSREGRVALNSLPVRLEGHKNPFIKDLRKIFGKTASVEGMRLGGHSIGGTWVEDAYVYRIR